MQNMSGSKTSLGLESNLAALLGYILTPCCLIGSILSLILFFTEKNNKFVRFHALQSLLILAIAVTISIVLGVVGVTLAAANMGFLGFAILGLRGLVGLAILGVLIYVGIQAYQNNFTKLPIIGDLADKWSN